MRSLFAVGFGGAIGSILRYVIGFLIAQRYGSGFPWSTLFINVSGSLLIGMVAEFSLNRDLGITPFYRLMLAVGVLGGYTTFSTFSFDSLTLVNEGAPYLALSYAAGSVILGFVAAFAGMTIAKMVTSLH
ncbi:MAG: fluoride efflux transporter CrcB [Candidatus Eremiobacteraeota bacterium]|nr:fluoride efflux transporter CrcB [Candidatus Eremiobacteraeota bacterium]